MLVDTDNLIPVSAFSRGQASAAFNKAHHAPVYVLKNNKVDTVIIDYDTYKAQQERLEDLEDLMLATERLERHLLEDAQPFSELTHKLGLDDVTADDLEDEIA